MVSGTRPRSGNPRARASVVAGALAVLAVPAGVVLSYYSDAVTLLHSTGSAAFALGLGAYAILLARRGWETCQRTLGRAGGEKAAFAGNVLGVLGVCIGLATALAVGFYGLLALFAS